LPLKENPQVCPSKWLPLNKFEHPRLLVILQEFIFYYERIAASGTTQLFARRLQRIRQRVSRKIGFHVDK